MWSGALLLPENDQINVKIDNHTELSSSVSVTDVHVIKLHTAVYVIRGLEATTQLRKSRRVLIFL